MQRIALVLAILGMSLAPGGLAHAQLGGPNVPSPLTEPPPPPPVDSDVDEGLSSLQQILIFVGAAIVLGVISFVIVHDAKRAAPTDDRPHKSSPAAAGSKAAAASGGPADPSASVARARERQRAKREKAKAKAARQQRKRNRPH